jgi:hypothetical protein
LTFPTPRPDRPDTAVYLTNMTGPAQPGRCLMAKVDERTIANMDVLLEEVFGDVPHGGDHESRKHVVKSSYKARKKEMLDGLRAVA